MVLGSLACRGLPCCRIRFSCHLINISTTSSYMTIGSGLDNILQFLEVQQKSSYNSVISIFLPTWRCSFKAAKPQVRECVIRNPARLGKCRLDYLTIHHCTSSGLQATLFLFSTFALNSPRFTLDDDIGYIQNTFAGARVSLWLSHLKVAAW